MVGRLRVVHAPSDVAGLAWGLSSALKQLGVESTTVQFQSNYLNYRSDVQLHLETCGLLARYTRRLIFFLRSLRRYDCFHFYFAESFIPFYIDLLILRLIGKRVFMTYQGSDIRLAYARTRIDGQVYTIHSDFANRRIPDFVKRLKCWLISRLAHKTYVVNPDLRLASPTSVFLPYTNVDLGLWRPLQSLPRPLHKPLRVLHAPSNRRIKGTDYILSTIEELRNEGFPIEVILAEKVPNQDIPRFASQADLVIDQLNIGWYGGFAVEMMALGIPILCYIDDRIAPLVSFYSEIPIFNITRATLRSTLIHLLHHPQEVIDAQQRSREFVERYHNPLQIAEQIRADYNHAS